MRDYNQQVGNVRFMSSNAPVQYGNLTKKIICAVLSSTCFQTKRTNKLGTMSIIITNTTTTGRREMRIIPTRSVLVRTYYIVHLKCTINTLH